MTKPIIGVLALQGGFAEHSESFRRLGVETREVRLPEQLDGLSGLVIPGGESTTQTRLLAKWGLLEPLRRMAANGFPVWGTCAGMIVLARDAEGLDREPLGVLDVRVLRNAFGRQVDSFEAPVYVEGMNGVPFPAVFIRAPVIESTGPGVDVLARLPDGRAVAVREGNVLATAFHPELTDDLRLHRLFLDIVARNGHGGVEG